MNGLPQPAYVMSEPHLSGYRVIIGYETLSDAQAAQAALCKPQAGEEAQPVGVIDGERVALPSIAADGPHKPSEHRLWLARQLLDSRMDDDEALSVVAFSPAITDRHTTPPAPEAERPIITLSDADAMTNPELLSDAEKLRERVERVIRANVRSKGRGGTISFTGVEHCAKLILAALQQGGARPCLRP